MSKDSIDRQVAIDEICLAWCSRKYDDCVHISDFKLGCYFCDGCSDVQAIMDLPPVQPERKTGKWIWQTWSRYMCSECGRITNVDECMEEPMYTYCPYCGTPMVTEEENKK